jgi:hypothetical protein
MTRRKFIQELIKAGSAIIVGVCWVAERASPRKFVRAVRLKKYPGLLKPLQDILKQSQWGG